MTDKLTKRFVSIDNGEVYYITDTQNLKTLNDYIQEFKKPEYEFTEKEAISAAKEEYWQMIYENSMSAKENENMLNKLFEENEQLKEEIARQKFSKKIMRENIKDYERAIKRLRKSYEKFDEMRLDRIRSLEKRLKKNGLSIYVNGCGDLE